MNYEDFAKVTHNPYFSMALAVLYASLGNMKEALNALKTGSGMANLNSPSLLLSFLDVQKSNGAEFYDYAETQRQAIRSLDTRIARVQSGQVFSLPGSVCGMSQAALSYYGGALYHVIAQTNDFVFEVARLLNADYKISMPILDEADGYSERIRKSADEEILADGCVIEPELSQSKEYIALFRANLWDTYAVYKMTRGQDESKGVEEYKKIPKKALEYGRKSKSEYKERTTRLIERHLKSG